MKAEKTWQLLLELEKRGRMTVSEIMKLLEVSGPTVRRELKYLDERGEIIRHHGSIEKIGRLPDPAHPVARRMRHLSALKKKLAELAAAELPEKGTVFIDGGTTTAHLAAFLNSPNLRVITNSLLLSGRLQELHPMSGGPELFLTGGRLNRKSQILLGHSAERMIDSFHADAAVLSACALDEDYLYDNLEDAAALQRKMMENSDKVIIVENSEKLGEKALCKVFPADRISVLITNFAPEKNSVISCLRRKKVRVMIQN